MTQKERLANLLSNFLVEGDWDGEDFPSHVDYPGEVVVDGNGQALFQVLVFDEAGEGELLEVVVRRPRG